VRALAVSFSPLFSSLDDEFIVAAGVELAIELLDSSFSKEFGWSSPELISGDCAMELTGAESLSPLPSVSSLPDADFFDSLMLFAALRFRNAAFVVNVVVIKSMLSSPSTVMDELVGEIVGELVDEIVDEIVGEIMDEIVGELVDEIVAKIVGETVVLTSDLGFLSKST